MKWRPRNDMTFSALKWDQQSIILSRMVHILSATRIKYEANWEYITWQVSFGAFQKNVNSMEDFSMFNYIKANLIDFILK